MNHAASAESVRAITAATASAATVCPAAIERAAPEDHGDVPAGVACMPGMTGMTGMKGMVAAAESAGMARRDENKGEPRVQDGLA